MPQGRHPKVGPPRISFEAEGILLGHHQTCWATAKWQSSHKYGPLFTEGGMSHLQDHMTLERPEFDKGSMPGVHPDIAAKLEARLLGWEVKRKT